MQVREQLAIFTPALKGALQGLPWKIILCPVQMVKRRDNLARPNIPEPQAVFYPFLLEGL